MKKMIKVFLGIIAVLALTMTSIIFYYFKYEAISFIEYASRHHSDKARDCVKNVGMTSDVALEAICKIPAEEGDPEAQTTMGLIANSRAAHDPGQHAEAVRWFTLAAKQGNVIASQNLAVKYITGQGVEKNGEKAVQLLIYAADHLDRGAQFALIGIFEKGRGVAPDAVQALKWAEIVADDHGYANVYRDKAREIRDNLKKSMTPNQIAEAIQQAKKF